MLTNCSGASSYVPTWVKTDPGRFLRAYVRKNGIVKPSETLSPLCEASVKADSKAFAALMAHIKDVDAADSTVIMIQVENESGLLSDSRDVSPTANQSFSSPVPNDFLRFLDDHNDKLQPQLLEFLTRTRKSGTWQKNDSWESVFGVSHRTDELFMAYHVAKYINRVAEAGKSQYNIPFYTNVWLSYSGDEEGDEWPVVAGGGATPGGYPSGGPVIRMLDIWLQFAQNLDFVAPDIYLNNYSATCAAYQKANKLLFIPEQRRDEHGARRIWEAFGSHFAIGTAPFGIDTITAEECAFTRHYGLLASVSEIVLETQRKPRGTSVGFFFDDIGNGRTPATPQDAHVFELGGFSFRIERAFVLGKPGPASGMIIHLGGDTKQGRFLLIGWGYQVFFTSLDKKADFTGILHFEEKYVDPETKQLQTLRVLGGDETRGGMCAQMPNPDPDYGDFPICITIPAHTMIAECTVYSIASQDSA